MEEQSTTLNKLEAFCNSLKRLRCIGVTALSLALTPQVALAVPTTFSFTGTVFFVFDSALNTVFQPNQAVSGSYTFESTAVDRDPDPAIGDYEGAVTALSGNVGNYAFSGKGGSIYIHNDKQGESFDFYGVFGSPTGLPVAGKTLTGFILSLRDDIGVLDAITSDALPTTPPELSRFSTGYGMSLYFNGSNVEGVRLGLATLTLVPEPHVFQLIIVGCLLLVARKIVPYVPPQARQLLETIDTHNAIPLKEQEFRRAKL